MMEFNEFIGPEELNKEYMEFNEFIGPEELNKEYKEFTLNMAGLDLDINECEKYCVSNKFDFNDIVMTNLEKYFNVYLPKYVSSFLNIHSTTNKFMIGVNDFGFIKGIPFKGELPIEHLTNMIYEIISKNVKSDNSINLNKHIKVNFNKINFNKDNFTKSNINPKFVNYLFQKNKYKLSYQEFILKYEVWKEKYTFINKKLVDLVNFHDSRIMLINYIKSLDPNNPVINLLLSDYQLEIKNHNELISYKNTSDNPYYWVMKWKDEYRNYAISLKPIFNIDFPLRNTPHNLIQSISDMIPYWINNNDDMNLYVISIDITSPITKNKFKYFDNITSKWLYCERKIINNEPSCIINK
jgi:hypothetical protein